MMAQKCRFLPLALLAALWVGAAARATPPRFDDELVLYAMPAPDGVSWQSPSRIFHWLRLGLGGLRRPFGHMGVHLRCASAGNAEFKGSVTTASDAELVNTFFFRDYGLGVLLHPYTGRFESAEELQRSVDRRLKDGRLAYVRFGLHPGTCRRLLTWAGELRARNIGRLFAIPLRPRYQEGATCSAFSMSFLDVGGLLEKEFDEWKVSVRIPAGLIGGPLTGRKVSSLSVLGSKAWATALEPHRAITLWEPTRAFEWIRARAKARLEAGASREAERTGQAYGLVYDRRRVPPPSESFWKAPEEPSSSEPVALLGARESAYVNFESPQTSPLRLSADGTRLFCANTADSRLSVFDVSAPGTPRLIAEVPVGIEPVSVAPRTNDEVWVVSNVSDSVSVVSVARGIVTDTIPAKDEPADVVFAGTPEKAFVTVARSNEVRVFDVASHALVATIPLFGENPRALAVSADRSKVYAAIALSGNRTTIIPEPLAPRPPAPANPALPPPPQVGLIVAADDPAWAPSVIKYTMPDNDVAEIDARLHQVTRYFSGVGTVNLGIAVNPATGDLFVANTEARNRVRFEPNLRGHIADNRITRIAVKSGAVVPFDLNPAIDYRVLPNPAARALALAQPTAIAFQPDGQALYVAAFGTDRVARVGVDGRVLARVEVGPAAGAAVAPRTKRGPRGLALHPGGRYLYVQNRISNTLSIVDTASARVAGEIPVGSYDPTPPVVRAGRGFLYDAKLSGNGTASCATCHVDADVDFLAWDLGDPGGQMQTIAIDARFGEGKAYATLHPMKGPLTTQTLRGLDSQEPLHWRGDRADFLAFNAAFDTLLGGTPVSADDMAVFRSFIFTLRFAGNPNQKLDRTLPATFAGGGSRGGAEDVPHPRVPGQGGDLRDVPHRIGAGDERAHGGGQGARGVPAFQGSAASHRVPEERVRYPAGGAVAHRIRARPRRLGPRPLRLPLADGVRRRGIGPGEEAGPERLPAVLRYRHGAGGGLCADRHARDGGRRGRARGPALAPGAGEGRERGPHREGIDRGRAARAPLRAREQLVSLGPDRTRPVHPRGAQGAYPAGGHADLHGSLPGHRTSNGDRPRPRRGAGRGSGAGAS